MIEEKLVLIMCRLPNFDDTDWCNDFTSCIGRFYL